MPSQIYTSPNGLLLTTSSPTTLPLGGECTLVSEEISGKWSIEADLPETQINHEQGVDAQSSSSYQQLEEWAFFKEEMTRFRATTTRAQSRGSSDWSSLADSTLAATMLEVDFSPSVAPLNFDGETPIPSQQTDLTPVNTGAPTWRVTGSYSRATYETAEPSFSEPRSFDFGSEPIRTLRFSDRTMPFGSEATMYSFRPRPSPSQEPREPFSHSPISSFSDPALLYIWPIASPGATFSSIPDSRSLQPPRSTCSCLEWSPTLPFTDPPALQISSSQWPYPPLCSRNTQSRPVYLLPNEPFSSFAPRPASFFGHEHDYSTGPGPSSFNAPEPSSNWPGRSVSKGPGCSSPIHPMPFSSFDHGPSGDSGLSVTESGPSSDSLQRRVHTAFIGPVSFFESCASNDSELSATRPGPSESVQHLVQSAYIGPGRTFTIRPGPFPSFGSCPPNDSELSATGPGPSSESVQQLLHGAYIGPGHLPSFGSGPSNDSALSAIGTGPSSFGPGSSAFGSELSASFKQDPSLDYSSLIRDINFVSFSPGPSKLTFDRGPSSISVNHTSVTKEGEKRFLCAPCKRGFDRAELLERHKATKSHANILVAEGIPMDPLPPPKVSCPFCDHIFNRPDNLRPHLLRHMGCDNQTRTRKVSVEESIRMGLAHIDPRCAR